MFKRKDHVTNFISYMNSRNTNIKFTCEEENENQILLLSYITITRVEDHQQRYFFEIKFSVMHI